MWFQIGTLGLGLVGVAASANWLVGRSSRRLRSIKAHAEVVALLPDGSPKTLLVEWLDELVRVHIGNEKMAAATSWMRVATTLTVAFAVAVFLAAFGIAGSLSGGPDWLNALANASLAACFVLFVATLWTIRKIRRVIDELRAKYLPAESEEDGSTTSS